MRSISMRLRLMLLVLSLLALFSAVGGGVLYYLSLRDAALREARSLAISRAEMLRQRIDFTVSENVQSARALAGMAAMTTALAPHPTPADIESANRLLDHFTAAFGVDVCYLIDATGTVIATSNRQAPDSFMGQQFGFRPYFRQAIGGSPSIYLALGTTSGRRGAYTSHPVPAGDAATPAGVVVIKASIDTLERELRLDRGEEILVTDPRGIIFASSRPEWLLHTLVPLSAEERRQVRETLQFGNGPWAWSGVTLQPGNHAATDLEGDAYQVYMAELNNFPGWQMIHLQSQQAIERSLAAPFLRIAGPAILLLWLLIGGSVAVFYRKASREIHRRRSVEQALRESEARYRFIYHNAPAMLHSVAPDGRLVSVSDHWLRAMGYAREEVVGQPLVDFMTPESALLATREIFPRFFRDGMVTDAPYRFRRKHGECMDVLLSAIAERDAEGRITRSLSVSIDVTERRRMEQALQQAKEELSQHSRNLERQVRLRTEEITSILKHAPDAISIRDTQGRFLMVNPRYEELFALRSEAIRGKTAHEVLPAALAGELLAADRQVLADQQPRQVEHRLQQNDGLHTYLSVKFPIYDETGTISGIGAISTDITALKKAQEHLRRLSAGVITSQENERAAIARELHDELGQMLTALRMDAVWLRRRLQTAEAPVLERIEAMCSLIETTLEDVRGIAIRLRPGVLDNLGLADALEWFTTDFERRTSIPCVLECDELPPLSNAVATVAYRIAQESLTNVARHAAAGRVAVALRAGAGLLELTIRDDGRGFDHCRLGDSEALGLAGMRERAGLVGGQLEIDSGPGQGTCIRFRMPLAEQGTP
jgi:PAS domain S-box-containing protein